MLSFKLWRNKNGYDRLYFFPNTEGAAHLYLLKSGAPRIAGALPHENQRLLSDLDSSGVMRHSYLDYDAFVAALRSAGFSVDVGRGHAQTKASRSPKSGTFSKIKSTSALYEESLALVPESIKFVKRNSKSDYTVYIDTREQGDDLAALFVAAGFTVVNAALKVGDIKVTSIHTEDEIVIERKTVIDLYSAVSSEESRAHQQAERMYEYQAAKAAEGIRVLTLWMMEASENGERTMYRAFPEIRQADGWMGYLTGILGQHVLECFSKNHLCYLTVKLIQTFFEQQLFYKVNPVERKMAGAQMSRKALMGQIDEEVGADHGVKTADKNILLRVLMSIPSLKAPVAKAIIEKGHTLSDVMSYDKEAWLVFDGVGPKLTEKLMSEIEQIK